MKYKYGLFLLFLFGAVFFLPHLTAAETSEARISLPQIKSRPGEEVEIPVRAAGIKNMAGIKLVLNYDSTSLNYEGLRKPDRLSSLMHMVNDKKPGTLILVMAGASGVNIKDGVLAGLRFKVKKSAKGKYLDLELGYVEAMGADLEPISVSTNDGKITVQE